MHPSDNCLLQSQVRFPMENETDFSELIARGLHVICWETRQKNCWRMLIPVILFIKIYYETMMNEQYVMKKISLYKYKKLILFDVWFILMFLSLLHLITSENWGTILSGSVNVFTHSAGRPLYCQVTGASSWIDGGVCRRPPQKLAPNATFQLCLFD